MKKRQQKGDPTTTVMSTKKTNQLTYDIRKKERHLSSVFFVFLVLLVQVSKERKKEKKRRSRGFERKDLRRKRATGSLHLRSLANTVTANKVRKDHQKLVWQLYFFSFEMHCINFFARLLQFDSRSVLLCFFDQENDSMRKQASCCSSRVRKTLECL